MNIARLNTRILFQKGTVQTDAIGNHTNEWEDYYSCYATAGGESGSEAVITGQTVENGDVSFTVRWCKMAAEVNSTGYRILWGSQIYDIVGIDHLAMKKRALKFRARKARR